MEEKGKMMNELLALGFVSFFLLLRDFLGFAGKLCKKRAPTQESFPEVVVDMVKYHSLIESYGTFSLMIYLLCKCVHKY